MSGVLRSLTEHAVWNGEGDGRSSCHPPVRAQVEEVDTQHLHDHVIVQGQIELMMVDKLDIGSGPKLVD